MPSPMISPTDMRGFSDAKGSWKIICMRRRSGRRAPRARPLSSCPSKRTLPPLAAVHVGLYDDSAALEARLPLTGPDGQPTGEDFVRLAALGFVGTVALSKYLADEQMF